MIKVGFFWNSEMDKMIIQMSIKKQSSELIVYIEKITGHGLSFIY